MRLGEAVEAQPPDSRSSVSDGGCALPFGRTQLHWLAVLTWDGSVAGHTNTSFFCQIFLMCYRYISRLVVELSLIHI